MRAWLQERVVERDTQQIQVLPTTERPVTQAARNPDCADANVVAVEGHPFSIQCRYSACEWPSNPMFPGPRQCST